MAKAMPTPDAALKDFFKDNRIFAALFNGYLFQGNEVIHPHELLPAEQAYEERRKCVKHYEEETKQ